MTAKPYSYGLKLLGIRDYFSHELRKKIAAKFGDDEADIAAAELLRRGFLDDERAAYNYARSKLLSGYGPYYIKAKLYEKGYMADTEYIDEIARKENIDTAGLIIKISERYKGRKGDAYKKYLKCASYLSGRGYSRELITDTIKKEDFE